MERIAESKTSRRVDGGFTLVEIMVSLVILLVGMLGLVQMMGVTAQHNLKNQLRDEAVMIGEEQMADLFRRPESAMPAFQVMTSPSLIRGGSMKYTVTRSSTMVPSTSSYRLTVNVGWNYKNVPASHEVQAMRTFTDGK